MHPDTWRATQNLTITAGVRWDRQGAADETSTTFTPAPVSRGLFGVSGVGHLFQPGIMTGTAPVFSLVPPGVGGFEPGVGHFNPSFGIAYRLNNGGGFLHWLTGDDAVLRAGFSISTIREGMGSSTAYGVATRVAA